MELYIVYNQGGKRINTLRAESEDDACDITRDELQLFRGEQLSAIKAGKPKTIQGLNNVMC